MKNKFYLFCFLLVALFCFQVSCEAPGNNSPGNTHLSLSENRGSLMHSENRSITAPEDTVHPIFLITSDEVRQAFNEYVLKGEKKQKVAIGEQQSTNVLATDPFNPSSVEELKLTVTFLPPLAQAQKRGYEFGLVAKARAPEDRKALENLAVSSISQKSNEINFNIKLQLPKNLKMTIPAISFRLINSSGGRIDPTKEPANYLPAENDVIGAVALKENGQELIFPLKYAEAVNVTNKMDKITLIVIINNEERQMQFQLRK